jgi:hypothetical protein
VVCEAMVSGLGANANGTDAADTMMT